MKKNIILSFFVAVVLTVVLVLNVPKEVASANKLIVFSQAKCPHCHDAMAFIDATVRPTFPGIDVEVRDVAIQTHLRQLVKIARERGLDMNALGTPVILLGDKIFVGWDASVQGGLMQALQDVAGMAYKKENQSSRNNIGFAL